MRLWPDTIAGRTLALLLGMTLLLIIVSAVILHDDRIEIYNERNRVNLMQRVTTLVSLLSDANEQERRHIIERVRGEGDDISLTAQPLVSNPSPHPRAYQFSRRLAHMLHLKDRTSIRVSDDRPRPIQRDMTKPWSPMSPKGSPQGLTISIQLHDDTWLNIKSRKFDRPPPWASRTLQLLGLLLVFLVISGLIIARLMARPMAQLARAAENLGLGQTQEPLAETGPREVRQTIRAFNRMQQRLYKHISDRSLMLAAVSHDLRTPVTTLRLRAEYIEDSEIRDKTLQTLSEMEAILNATLSFARDEAADENARSTDLSALLQSMVDDHVDLGGNAHYNGPDKFIFICRPIALKRALNNLIGNALKYAGSANVSLIPRDEGVEIHIEDDGPGVPEQSLQQLFTPFFRLESSRNRQTGGTGLGLAVARSIVLAHGGELTLENRKTGGLRALMFLPKAHNAQY